jgi:hypothetical protein
LLTSISTKQIAQCLATLRLTLAGFVQLTFHHLALLGSDRITTADHATL